MPAKTFKIKFPIIDENLKRHFIRGYFDGDGCIYKIKNRKKSYIITIFTASKNFMNDLIDTFNQVGIISHTYERNSGFAISFSKMQDILKFKDLIYSDSSIYLERKKIKFP